MRRICIYQPAWPDRKISSVPLRSARQFTDLDRMLLHSAIFSAVQKPLPDNRQVVELGCVIVICDKVSRFLAALEVRAE
ncbi:MAG: hypothetical protein JWQ21_109 [Herminiimonas sp.]|nr:hypothetical protein [Herminiimonas sp.]